MEIEKRFTKADFGEDYVPIDPISKLKSELEIWAPLEDNIKVSDRSPKIAVYITLCYI